MSPLADFIVYKTDVRLKQWGLGWRPSTIMVNMSRQGQTTPDCVRPISFPILSIIAHRLVLDNIVALRACSTYSGNVYDASR